MNYEEKIVPISNLVDILKEFKQVDRRAIRVIDRVMDHLRDIIDDYIDSFPNEGIEYCNCGESEKISYLTRAGHFAYGWLTVCIRCGGKMDDD
jgi:hypothetical protein